jgi:hypothetical protein
VTYFGDPLRIYASASQWAEVVFPEPLVGDLIETPEGIQLRLPPNFRDRAYFQVSTDDYAGSVFLHGASGATYHLHVLARPACADATVTLIAQMTDEGDDVPASESNTSASGSGRQLMEIMLRGDKPPRNFHKEYLRGSTHERLVFRQGPISFYIKEVWRGRRQAGIIMLAENDGRTPFRVAIEAINYQSPEINRLFGKVKEIAMLPPDLQLGPAPQFAADIYNPQHQGLIFIVSERSPDEWR